MTIKHTTGPWTAKVQDTINDQPAYWLIIGAGGVVGDVQSVNPADAALIAAAPDLLAALQACELRLTHLAQNSVNVIAELKQARAAIAKATA